MNTATIFYIDAQRLSGHDKPWGVRYDASILPQGSVVVGFMKWQGESIQEVLDIPHILPNQEQSWNENLEDAREVLKNGYCSRV